MTTPIVFLKGRLLVWDTGMYRFDLNRWPIVQRIGRRFRSNLYILVYHTNRRPMKNMIDVAVNRLVGMGLKHWHIIRPIHIAPIRPKSPKWVWVFRCSNMSEYTKTKRRTLLRNLGQDNGCYVFSDSNFRWSSFVQSR